MSGIKSKLLLYLPLLFFVFFLVYSFQTSLINSQIVISMFYGLTISTFNFLVGMILYKYGLYKSDKIFLIIVLGGMVIRLFIVFVLIVITLKLLLVSLNSFIFTLFICYFYYLLIEIVILTQKGIFSQ